jgi:hypothetical protein
MLKLPELLRGRNDAHAKGQGHSFVVVGKIVHEDGRFGAHHFDCQVTQPRRSFAPMLGVCTAALDHCDWPFGHNAHLGAKVPNSKNTSPRRAYPGKRKAPLLREALDGETLGLGELWNSPSDLSNALPPSLVPRNPIAN